MSGVDSISQTYLLTRPSMSAVTVWVLMILAGTIVRVKVTKKVAQPS